jgi:hypothetical protein
VIAKQHVFNEERTNLSLWLEFQGQEPVHVRTASDGNLSVEPTPPEADADMGEAGRVEMVDVSEVPPFSEIVGRTLIGVDALNDDGTPCGVSLNFEGVKTPLVLLNWGDELHVGLGIPTFLAR